VHKPELPSAILIHLSHESHEFIFLSVLNRNFLRLTYRSAPTTIARDRVLDDASCRASLNLPRSLVVGLSQADARAPAVFVDELDAGGLQCMPQSGFVREGG
jgi:hypothetical protein